MSRLQIMEDADAYGGKISIYGLNEAEMGLAQNMTNLQLKEDIFGHRGYSRRLRQTKTISREMD